MNLHTLKLMLLTSSLVAACTSANKPIAPTVEPGAPVVDTPTVKVPDQVDPDIFKPLPAKDSLNTGNVINTPTGGTPASVTPGSAVTLPAGTPANSSSSASNVPGLPAVTVPIPYDPKQPDAPVIPLNPAPAADILGNGNANCKIGSITMDQIEAWVQAAGGAQGSTKYMYIPTDLLGPGKEKEADLARVGGLKALFHTSFVKEIKGFSDVSGGFCAVYKLQLDQIWGDDWQQNWRILTSSDALPDRSFDPSRQRFVAPSSAERALNSKGIISAERIAYSATFPTNYQALAKLPQSNDNIKQSRNKAIGGYLNGIPCGPRKLVVRESEMAGETLLYFMSGDPSSHEQGNGFPSTPPVGDYNAGSNIPGFPGRRISGSESIQQLPNRLLRYIVWRNPGDKGTKALNSGVIDPANPHNGYTLVVGRSCISCHNNGIRGVPVDTADKGNGWSTQEEFDPYFNKAQSEYFGAMSIIVNAVSSGDAAFKDALIKGRTREPIHYLISRLETERFGEPRSMRPYSSCRTNEGDKFQNQIKGMFAQIDAEMDQLKSGTVPQAPAGGTSTPTTPTTPSSVNGATAFAQSCAGAGCHNSSASADRMINGATSIPARMLPRARNKNPNLSQAEIDAIEAYLRGS